MPSAPGTVRHSRSNVIAGIILGLAATLSPLVVPSPGFAQSTPAHAPAISWKSLRQASAATRGEKVFVRAKVLSVTPPAAESDPTVLQVADGTGTSLVYVHAKTYKQQPVHQAVQPGAFVELFAEVTGAYQSWELTVSHVWNLKLVPVAEMPREAASWGPSTDNSAPVGGRPSAPQAAPLPKGDFTRVNLITKSMNGRGVRIRGEVVNVEPPSTDRTPTRVTLKDETGLIRVVYWSDVAGKLVGNDVPDRGDRFEFQGTVNEYHGELEVKVVSAESVRAIR